MTIMLISYFISTHFDKIFLIGDVDIHIINIVVLLIGLNVSLSFIFQPFDTILVAFNRFDIVNMIGITSSIVRTLLIIAVLKMEFSLIAMAVCILFTDLITYGIVAIYSKKIFKGFSVGINYINKQSLKKLFSFGIFNFMRHLSRIILSRAGAIIIGIFLGPAMIALYSIAESLINYVWVITKGASRVTLPLASGLHAIDQINKIREMMLLIPKYILFISVFIAIQFYFIGDQFINIWMGEGYHQTYIIFCILMIARLGMMSHETMIDSVVGMGHNKFVGYVSMFEAISNILLSLYLLRIWGLAGVAIGTVIPLTITRSFIIPVYCCKLVNIKFKTYFKKVLLPTLICSLPIILITYASTTLNPPDNYFRLFVNIIVTFIAVSLIFYRFLESEIKLIILNIVGLGYLKKQYLKLFKVQSEE
jgi:O-antigen/teichoic acid export membrane protein